MKNEDVLKNKELKTTERILLIYLLDRNGSIESTNSTLANDLGLSKATIIRTINSLKEKEIIKTYKIINNNNKVIIGKLININDEGENLLITTNNTHYEEY